MKKCINCGSEFDYYFTICPKCGVGGKKKMSSKTKFLIFFLIILALLFVTNPTKDDFNYYVMKEVQNNSDSSENSAFATAVMKSLVELFYKRDNYYLVSTYTIDSSISGSNKDTVYLGMFKIFIRVK